MPVRWIDDVAEGEEREVGKKAAALSAAARAGLDVPRGFVVTAPTFEEFVRRNGLEAEIEQLLSGTDRDDLAAVRRTANRIRSLITDTEMDDETREDIHEAYEKINMAEEVRNAGGEAIDLVGGQRETEFVAVRSSPTGARIPGAHENAVNVNGKDAVVRAVRDCWASLYAAEALRVEEELGDIHSMAVVVQRMVEPEVSGAVFNSNPINGSGMVVEALWGLGTALSDGSATPDRYVVDEHGTVRSQEIANKGWKVERDPTSGKTLKQRVASTDREAPTLEDADISEIHDAVRKAERTFTGNVRLDFAVARGKLFVLDIAEFATTHGEETGDREGLVRGRGASAGSASGTVTLAYSDTDIEGIEPDRVVVAVDAAERLTPVLPAAAGIVTDTGGLASNLSAMARRLGIPCIVGTGNATDMLTTGETVTLDGTSGRVHEGDVRMEDVVPDGPSLDAAGGPDGALTATRVTVWNGDGDATGAIHTDYVSPGRASELARQHAPEPVWARTDAPAAAPDNLRLLAAHPDDANADGVVLQRYGDVLRAPDLVSQGASLLALDVPALRQDGGTEALRNAVERLAADAGECETAVLLDDADPGLVDSAVAAGIDRIAVPAHRLDAVRQAVARAEKRFMLDKLRQL